NQGADIKTALMGGTVTVRLLREPDGVLRDGALENTVVAHEWGHYLSNRLIGDGAGLNANQAKGLGEGWSDFNAQLMLVRDGEDWTGTFAQDAYNGAGISPDAAYFGIRRFPYSTDMTKNPLTFQHIEDSVPIVSGAPCNGCNPAVNSEVHNTGEVWASMLWECYAALLNDTLGGTPRLTFAEAQSRMRDYLVASLKLTPSDPTFVEARDAMLAVTFANDPADHALFCAAFAKRGLGQGAVAPDRFSTDNGGVVESFSCQGQVEIVDVAIEVPVGCNGDTDLDDGETGVLSVTVRNIGGGPLTSTSAQVTTAHPLVNIGNGGVITFASTDPFEEATGTVNVSISGAVGIEDFRLDVSASDPSVSLPVPPAFEMVRANADEVLAASATDDVEASQTLWTSGGSGGPWVREQISTTPPLDFVWSGPDAGGVTDFA
ncbi:MAG: M36 family metallopeptidase, partial [Actinobacteria bacterium]|nr:M36 family metallopeptidase [Actinomycetota bacterium]